MCIELIKVGEGVFHRLDVSKDGVRCLDHSKKELARQQKLIEFGDIQLCRCVAVARAFEEIGTPEGAFSESGPEIDSDDLDNLREIADDLKAIGIVCVEMDYYTHNGGEIELRDGTTLYPDPGYAEGSKEEAKLEKLLDGLLHLMDKLFEGKWQDDEGTGYGRGDFRLYPFHGLIADEHSVEEERKIPADEFVDTHKPLPAALKKGLQAAGITNVHVAYSGCGDSGQMDSVTDQDGDDVPKKLTDGVDDFVCSILDYDWYNNDGGGGTVDIDIATGQIEVDAHFNENNYTDPKRIAWAFGKNPWLAGVELKENTES